ncbi:PREDICTED: uncharacterized protein LOC100636578 [Amphimedon queenslandica]|uniref:Uncharacterized protein n=1 Tax=Amphimedon queenslandica TaxID=400682 RepID=A0A1X7UVJ2_AMPQE|nr:PREDICTED: uncharacterized protein LOC100636578 [Amphimedon queenslandica]|eukprot:XP_011403959.2 PREDICTED: uncharacterized protein LOC100636578 [Amphimedon queenslandica]
MEETSDATTCCLVLDKSWLEEVPKITCKELQETAKLLPGLINTEKKEGEMTEEENRSSPLASSGSSTQLNPRPSLVSPDDDQGIELIADLSIRKKSMSKNKPPQGVPLVPYVFCAEVIPQHPCIVQQYPQHHGLVPDMSIKGISCFNKAPNPSGFSHSPNPLVSNRLAMPSSDRRSSIPKLPQITASPKPLTQPSRPHHYSDNPVRCSARLVSSNSHKKPEVPLPLQNVRQQHQKPLQDTSRAMHPSGMVHGAFPCRRKQITHPGYAKRNALPVDSTRPVVSYRATATPVHPEPHFYINPQPQVANPRGYAKRNALPVDSTPPVVSYRATATPVHPEPRSYINPQPQVANPPGYAKRNALPVDSTPPVVSYRATATPVHPEPRSYINPQPQVANPQPQVANPRPQVANPRPQVANPRPQVANPLKPTNVHVKAPFDYLQKTSRKILLRRPAKPTKEIEPVEEQSHALIEEESTPAEKEERIKKIVRRATFLHLNETDEKANYLVDFTHVNLDPRTREIINKFRGSVICKLDNLTDEIREDYEKFLDDMDAIHYYRRRQAEQVLKDYSPRSLLAISSAMPNIELLQAAIKPEVLTLVYDFKMDSYVSLYRKMKELLDDYMDGAKAKSIGFVCKGAPGYMYLLHGKPITPAKLLKDIDLLKFWKEIGSLTSKISIGNLSVVHLMESNVAGNPQGVELLSNFEAAMFTNRVKVVSPHELEPKGREMIQTYFFPEKFKMWKMKRNSILRLYPY